MIIYAFASQVEDGGLPFVGWIFLSSWIPNLNTVEKARNKKPGTACNSLSSPVEKGYFFHEGNTLTDLFHYAFQVSWFSFEHRLCAWSGDGLRSRRLTVQFTQL